ncbi:unnamed protein product, partial [Callosobruchus maculatus]
GSRRAPCQVWIKIKFKKTGRTCKWYILLEKGWGECQTMWKLKYTMSGNFHTSTLSCDIHAINLNVIACS